MSFQNPCVVKILLLGPCLMSRLLIIPDVLIAYYNTIWIVGVPGGVITILNTLLRLCGFHSSVHVQQRLLQIFELKGGCDERLHPRTCKTVTCIAHRGHPAAAR